MRIARFSAGAEPVFGTVEGPPGNGEITVIEGDPFLDGINRTLTRHKLSEVRLSAPLPVIAK